jgi:hypothetical protein
MGELRIDPRFVAMGYDRNKNGQVQDDLRIDGTGLAGADGVVSVGQLAAALGRDQIVISGDAVSKRAAAPRYPDLPESRTIRSIYNIAVQSHWQNYGSATNESVAAMRSTLQAIAEVSNDNGDFRSRKIYEIANDAIWRTSYSVTQDNYTVLREAMRHIQAMAEVPSQPATIVKDLSDSVNANSVAINTLASQLRDPAAASAVDKAKAKAAAERKAAEAVPTWQKWCIFGLFKMWGHNKAAKKIELYLAVLQASDPGLREAKLADLARRAYEITVAAEGVKNLDDSQKITNDSKAIRKELDELKKDVDLESSQIADLLKKIA